MVTVGYELGARVFSSVRVWGAAIALTFAFCEGAGFGAFSYHCVWYEPFSAVGPQCTLTGQALLPPAVSWATFGWNAATLWLAGFLDGGWAVGLLFATAALAISSRMSSDAVVRVFSALPLAAASVFFGLLGCYYEMQATLAAGLPQVRL